MQPSPRSRDSLSSLAQLKARFVVSFVVICALIVAATVLMRHQIRRSATDSRVVNIAGRQRMLSQAMAKQSLLVLRSRDAGERKRLTRVLSDLDGVWDTPIPPCKMEMRRSEFRG